MSKSRARTGLSKPREIEKELFEATWRENRRELQNLTITTGFGPEAEEAARDAIAKEKAKLAALNPLARLLWDLSWVHPNAAFRDAFEDMKRLGLTGSDLGKHMKDAFGWIDDMEAARALALVDQFVAEGSSLERAMERAAAELAVEGNSLDAAVQRIKRWWYAR